MTDCPAADGSSPQQRSFDAAPPMCIDPAKTYIANMKTSMGDLTIALYPDIAPKTVNNFVVLARYHYYDGLIFHRVINGFVLQGGCPEGSGMGGPGYRFEDELPSPNQYEIGSLAMANAGPNTTRSLAVSNWCRRCKRFAPALAIAPSKTWSSNRSPSPNPSSPPLAARLASGPLARPSREQFSKLIRGWGVGWPALGRPPTGSRHRVHSHR